MSELVEAAKVVTQASATSFTTIQFIKSDLGKKLLGPTADYYGGQLAKANEYIINNVGNVLRNATELLGKRIEEEGTVQPRVVKKIMD